MKKIKLYSLLIFGLAILNSCEQETEPTNIPFASFEAYLKDITVDPNSEFNKSIKIYTANITNQDRVIDLDISTNLDPNAYVAPTSVTIPANTNEATLDLTFKDINLDLVVDKTFKYSIKQTSELYAGESRTLLVAKGCGAGLKKLKIAVTLDAYPEEVYWRITNNATNAVVLTNSPTPGYGAYAGLTGIQRDAVCLPAGTYTFQVFDAYQDGGGSIAITVEGTQVFSSNGRYGAGTSSTFTIN